MMCFANFIFFLMEKAQQRSTEMFGHLLTSCLALSGYGVVGRARETSLLSCDCFVDQVHEGVFVLNTLRICLSFLSILINEGSDSSFGCCRCLDSDVNGAFKQQ